MEIAMVGLGKMGANMTKRLLQGGHRVIVSDLNQEAVAAPGILSRWYITASNTV